MLPNDAGGLFLNAGICNEHFFFATILVIEEPLVTRIEMQLDSWVLSFSVRFINSMSMVSQSINQKVISFFFSPKRGNIKVTGLIALVVWSFDCSLGEVLPKFFFHLFCDARWKVSQFFHASAGLNLFCVIKFNNAGCYDTF